ncbi:APC family permease [Streptomyces flaveolus]|uniref:APC family permease n=1 Tax=Streptomyces flaveolus TaxID=67297 RepID=UPI003F540E6A
MRLLPKHMLVGRPMRTSQLTETLLPKRLAIPVFCSDPLSSVAYATEEILLILAYGGTQLLHLAWYVAVVIIVLLVVVISSYRQTCYAYPNGGGAYAVSADNLGRSASLTAASALLVDYVLTVAVSVVAGVAAITSAAPSLGKYAVELSVAAVAVLTLMNLRGVKESGRVFAIPTYGFVLGVYMMFAFSAARLATGETIRAESADLPIHATGSFAGLAVVFLAMRAFASGCTALTGVEAISNGVPAFRKPKSRNAAQSLAIMGVMSISMFAGITVLALLYRVHVAGSPTELGLPADAATPTALAQIAKASFGNASLLFYYVQAFTAGILILAANTAFNGFPLLASLLAQHRFLPRQLHNRGDRLVYSNGIILLALAAIGLIIAFDADVSSIIQLYIVGVFVSFTLSQAGMVKHWTKELADTRDPATRRRIRRSQAINATGAFFTGVVLIIVLATKFLHGAWIVTIAMPLLFLAMRGIRRHYDRVARELAVPATAGSQPPSRNHAIVLVSQIHAPTLRAVGYARSIRPHQIEALNVSVEPYESEELKREWDAHALDVPLVVLDSPYREVTRPVLDYVRRIRRESPRDVVTVIIPEYVLGRWWEQVLHNQSALRLKARLLFMPGVMVTSVPYQLDAALRRQTEPGTD